MSKGRKKVKGRADTTWRAEINKSREGSNARKNMERWLRDLHEVGYLDHAPHKIDGSLRRDKGARAAIDQFMEMHEDLDEFTPEARERIEKRRNELYVRIQVVDRKDQDDGQGTYRPESVDPKKIAGKQRKERRVRIGWAEESLRFAIEHPRLKKDEDPETPIDYTVKLVVDFESKDGENVSFEKKVKADKRVTEFDLGTLLEDLVPEAERALRPLKARAEITVTRDHPDRGGSTITFGRPLTVHRFKNFDAIKDDTGRAWFVSNKITKDLLALKSAVNDWDGGDQKEAKDRPKLNFNSTLRTWSKQMELWVSSRRNTKRNGANQPGTSWHETGRAVDISTWGLKMKPATQVATNAQIKDTVIETDEEREFYEPYLEQLDELRKLALDNGFTLAGRKWQKHPFNTGYEQSRVPGSVVELDHGAKRMYSFALSVDGASPKTIPVLLKYGVPRKARSAEAALGGSVQQSIAVKGLPVRAMSRRNLEFRWEVPATEFKDLSPEELAGASSDSFFTFEWRAGKKKREATFAIDDVDLNVPFYDLQVRPDEPLAADSSQEPSARRLAFHTSDGSVTINAADAYTMMNGDVAFKVSAKDWKTIVSGLRQATMEDGEMISEPDARWLEGWKVSFLVENKKVEPCDYKSPDGKMLSPKGRLKPAFQAGSSEKHHFQNKNKPDDTTDLKAMVDGLNEVLQTFRDEVTRIADKDAKHLIKKWAVKDYKEDSKILRGAAWIGNVPDKARASADFEQLAKEIEAETEAWRDRRKKRKKRKK